MRFIFVTATWKRLLGLLAALLLSSCVTAQSSCPASCVCSDDGFSAACSDVGERVPPSLAGSLVSLDLSGHGLQAVDASTFANLTLLEHLDLSRGRIAQVSADAFRALRRLRRLVLSDNLLRALPLEAFPDSLLELRLAGNPLPLPGAGPFLRAFGLSRLDLSRCAVADVGADAFSQLPSLVELDLRGNGLQQLVPVAFTGLQRLYVDQGALGGSSLAVSQVVTYVVEAGRTVAPTNQVGSQVTEYGGRPDAPAYSDDGADVGRDGLLRWQYHDQGSDFSPLFGPGSRAAADNSLFKGAPFQATGEVTVVYASDLQNLRDTLLVLAGLAVLCFMLAALQRAVETVRGRRRAWQDAYAGRAQPSAADGCWWDAEHMWLELEKTTSELPPPYPHPPSYDDSVVVGRDSGEVQPAVHGRAGHS